MSKNDLTKWLNGLKNLVNEIKKLDESNLLRSVYDNFNFLYQIFQAYVYTLLVYSIINMEMDISINAMNLNPQGLFRFKNNPRAPYSSNFSYFRISINNNNNRKDFYIVININVNFENNEESPILNLDVAIIDVPPENNNIRPQNILFFIECKSVDRASPEYVATVLGQYMLINCAPSRYGNSFPSYIFIPYYNDSFSLYVNFLIFSSINEILPKFSPSRSPYFCFQNSLALLAVRGSISSSARNLFRLIERVLGESRLYYIEKVEPGQEENFIQIIRRFLERIFNS